jgi:hypothetical protein
VFSALPLDSALDLRVPAHLTGLLQLLQRLVCSGARYYCAGSMPLTKLPDFLQKMEHRYPILRNTRERTYDRARGRAVVHMVVYPLGHTTFDPQRIHLRVGPHLSRARDELTAFTERPRPESKVAWWILSGPGTCGLLDPGTPDAHVAKDAMSAHDHIVVGEYVLMYAAKREPRSVFNQRTGKPRTILKDTSTLGLITDRYRAPTRRAAV